MEIPLRDLPNLVDARTLAAHCRVSAATARRWFREGRLPGRKLGRKWYAARGAVLVALCEVDDYRAATPRLTVLGGGR